MAINVNLYEASEEINLVEVYVNGKSVGICEESAVEAMLYALGFRK